MFIICDLDGTLADIEHRRHHVTTRPKNWSAFFRACTEDSPIVPVIETVKALYAAGHRIEIWSGRSDEVRHETEIWLAAAGLPDVTLKMRADGDSTPDDVLKESWLLEEPALPDLVFDDRNKVVAMWRLHGIVCAQVAPGDF